MWPTPDGTLDRVLAAEGAVEDLYRLALIEWSPLALAAVLPAGPRVITAAGVPPDVSAVGQSPAWTRIAEAVIVAGVSALFAAAVVEALSGLGVPLPGWFRRFSQDSAGKPQVAPPSGRVSALRDLGKQIRAARVGGRDEGVSDRDPAGLGVNPQESAAFPQVAPAVLAVVNDASRMDAAELRAAMRLVDEDAHLSGVRDQVVEAQRAAAARIPDRVAERVTAAVLAVTPDADGTVTLAAQRSAAADVLDPDGPELQAIAEGSWHLAAAVQNHAVQAAANLAPDRDELEKVWICTLDGRTRPTHWAADGQRVPLGGKFSIGADQLEYPADPAGSPAEVINCRCRMGVLAHDEALPDEADRHTERLDGRDSVAIRRDGRSQDEEIRARRRKGNTRARDNRDGLGTVASAQPEENAMTESRLDRQERVALELVAAEDAETFLTFTDALFAVTGVPTDDRRMLAGDIALKMRDFPIPLQWQERTGDGHKGSVTVGVIESMSYRDGEVRGSGYMLNNDNAAKALDLIKHGVCKPSVDMADATATTTFADGTEVTEANFDPSQAMFEAYKAGTITAATIVAIPAFGQTTLELNPEREARGVEVVAEGLAAAIGYQQPEYDPALFADADPNLLRTMRLTLDPESGHVFGFVATWKDQHRSVGLGNIRPPRSETGYEHFHTSPGVHLTSGATLPVGRLTVGIGHAPTRGVSAAAAQAHYDNVDSCWALGRISEHRLGIYFSGVVAPWASPEKVQMGLASPVSGDWRPIGPSRNLELVAVLSVNTPGFLCKVETDGQGDPLAMVASMGAVDSVERVFTAAPLTLADVEQVMESVLARHAAASLQSVDQAALAARLDLVAERAVALVGQPPTPTDRMAALIAEFGWKVRKPGVYWHKDGTPAVPGEDGAGLIMHDPRTRAAKKPGGGGSSAPSKKASPVTGKSILDSARASAEADVKKSGGPKGNPSGDSTPYKPSADRATRGVDEGTSKPTAGKANSGNLTDAEEARRAALIKKQQGDGLGGKEHDELDALEKKSLGAPPPGLRGTGVKDQTRQATSDELFDYSLEAKDFADKNDRRADEAEAAGQQELADQYRKKARDQRQEAVKLRNEARAQAEREKEARRAANKRPDSGLISSRIDADQKLKAAQKDADARHAKTNARTEAESKMLSDRAKGADDKERTAADLKDKIGQLDKQIAENRRNNRDVTEVVKKRRELQTRLDALKAGTGKAWKDMTDSELDAEYRRLQEKNRNYASSATQRELKNLRALIAAKKAAPKV